MDGVLSVYVEIDSQFDQVVGSSGVANKRVYGFSVSGTIVSGTGGTVKVGPLRSGYVYGSFEEASDEADEAWRKVVEGIRGATSPQPRADMPGFQVNESAGAGSGGDAAAIPAPALSPFLGGALPARHIIRVRRTVGDITTEVDVSGGIVNLEQVVKEARRAVLAE